ncbi:MAG: hypothetical protein LKF79_00035 [Solobacterium sp.]|jgi:hypothetical protein|nr:hypothetical protein [Solobacterium sp.]MCH4221791.1 hypothetical protein [Solobacterium sp.]MCH4265013.1 hypothetical protein [Solobacterium sp.]
MNNNRIETELPLILKGGPRELSPEQMVGLIGCCEEGMSAEDCADQLQTDADTAAYWYACLKDALQTGLSMTMGSAAV